jgi:Matrixin
MTFRSRLFAALACVSLSVLAAAAQPVAPSSQALVVRGRVAGSDARWDATSVLYTYVTIDVTRVVLGSGVPSRLVVKQLGGESGGIGLWIAGQATFAADEDVLLELVARPNDGTLLTAGLAHGKWRVDTDVVTGAESAVQRSDGGTETRLPLNDVALALASGRMPLASFTAAPAEFSAPLRGASAAFAYLPTDGGYPARWHEVDSNVAVFVDHPTALPGTWTGSTADATAAINLWRNSGMDLDLRDGGATLASGLCPSAFTGNGRIAIAYNDPCNVPGSEWVVGGGYYTTGDLRTVNGVTFQKFLQGFVVLNDAGPQTSSAGCFRDAITHGIGHALGLGHSDSTTAIMQAAPPANCSSGARGLGADDTAGITAIYEGIPSGANPPSTPTAFTVTSALSTVIMNWTPASTGGQAQRYLIDAGTAPGNYNLGTIVVNAPATSFAAGPAGVGMYYLRLRAQNALGTSAPTPESSVNVGNCTAPPAPASFTASSNDTFVNLQWTPPATGVVQGYQVVAGTAPGLANLAVLPYPATVTSLGAPVAYGTYYVRVLATNVCGVSPPSNEVTLVVQPCAAPPTAPTGLVGAQSAGIVSLAWTAPTGVPPTSYTVVAGSAPGAADIVVFSTGTTATGLAAPAPRGTYHVRVIATNACGQSGASNEVVVVVP